MPTPEASMSRNTLLKSGADWHTYAKGVLMAAVAVATVLETQEVPAWLKVVARCTVGLGAMFGIASAGLKR
jgi:hypothetical protein